MIEQNAKPHGGSRVMKPGCAHGLILNEDDRPSLAIDGYPLYEVPVIPGAEHSPHPSLPRMRPEMNRQVVGKGFTRHAVKRIEFHDSLRAAAPDAWDVSEAGDGSVLAWLEDDILHFAAEGGVIAPEDCGELFRDYAYCEEIRFNGCFDTSRATNMKWMFNSCRSLTALDVSGFDTSRVTDMEGMFCGCNQLRSLDVSNFDTSQVTNMDFMFCGCRQLQTLNLSGFDTSQVTSMLQMFDFSKSLQSLNLSGFDTARVTRMGEMFRDCRSLTALDLSGFNTAQVKDMRKMFAGCSALTALDLSGFRIAGDANVDGMFLGCNALSPENIRGYALLPPGVRASLPGLDAAVRERLLRQSEAAKRERPERAQESRAAQSAAPKSTAQPTPKHVPWPADANLRDFPPQASAPQRRDNLHEQSEP